MSHESGDTGGNDRDGLSLTEPRDDRAFAEWQLAKTCLSIASKFLRRLEKADAVLSVSGAKNSSRRADPMVAMAAEVAISFCGPISRPIISPIFFTSPFLKQKTAVTGGARKCMARMRRTRS